MNTPSLEISPDPHPHSIHNLPALKSKFTIDCLNYFTLKGCPSTIFVSCASLGRGAGAGLSYQALPNQKHMTCFSRPSNSGVCFVGTGVVILTSSTIKLSPALYLNIFINILLEICCFYSSEDMAFKGSLSTLFCHPFIGSADGSTFSIFVQIHLMAGYWRIS